MHIFCKCIIDRSRTNANLFLATTQRCYLALRRLYTSLKLLRLILGILTKCSDWNNLKGQSVTCLQCDHVHLLLLQESIPGNPFWQLKPEVC